MKAKIGLKLVCILAFLGFGNSAGFAQSWYAVMDYKLTVPVEDIKEFNDGISPLGIGLEVGRLFNQRLSIGFNVSWNIFREDLQRTSGGFLANQRKNYIRLIPVTITMRYHFKDTDKGFAPFVGVGVGEYYVKQGIDSGFFSTINIFSYEETHGYFGFAPEIGFTRPIGSAVTGVVKFKYNFVSEKDGFSPSYWGVNLGLRGS